MPVKHLETMGDSRVKVRCRMGESLLKCWGNSEGNHTQSRFLISFLYAYSDVQIICIGSFVVRFILVGFKDSFRKNKQIVGY